jgi:hypothetical protein
MLIEEEEKLKLKAEGLHQKKTILLRYRLDKKRRGRRWNNS